MSRLSAFQYEVPPELIAQTPAQPRDMSRLMCLRRDTGAITHHRFRDLPSLLDDRYVLVVNDSKVIRASLRGEWRGAPIAVFLLKPASENTWRCLPDPAVAVLPGEVVSFPGSPMQATLVEVAADTVVYRFDGVASVQEEANRIGDVPLPPYVRDSSGQGQYQTVYAREDGSVAAPTAGLHFTPEVLDRLRAAGIERRHVTLHVGYGTFATVSTEDLAQHAMLPESFTLTPETATLLNQDRAQGKTVLAVGTTSTRVLESCTTEAGEVQPQCGETSLFIYPPYRFKCVGALLTNFHMPGLTPVMLTAALAGYDLTMEAYRVAIAERYRFYSFGDSMLIL